MKHKCITKEEIRKAKQMNGKPKLEDIIENANELPKIIKKANECILCERILMAVSG